MAEGKVCVCPQCGKKFKLKAGFSAASFACTACSATVWVDGKPAAPATKRASRGRAGGRAGRRGRAGATPARGKRQPKAPDSPSAHRGGARHQQKDNTAVIFGIGGGLVLVAVAVYFALGGFSAEPEKTTTAGSGADGGRGVFARKDTDAAKPAADGCGDGCTAGNADDTGDGSGDADKPAPDGGKQPTPGGDNVPTGDEPKTPVKKLAGSDSKKKYPKGTSRWDPPATLGHLDNTPADMRATIDEQIKLMMDPQAGRDSLIAKQKLAAIGKPAFLPILGAMAKVRDTITDVDSMDERLIESSLLLADQCLREMDGYLESKQKAPIRPGTDKKYITYILRLHYKRWVQALEAMPEMPGPYDPSQEYKDDGEDDKNYDD